jgi:fructokinase
VSATAATLPDAPTLTVIGEALIDLVPSGPPGSYQARPGGSPFNVAIALARLRNRTALMARVGNTGFGPMLHRAAAAEGIDLDAAPQATEPTTLAVVTTADGAPEVYDFYLEGTADWQWSAAELAQIRPDTEVLHFGSLASVISPGSDRIATLVRDVSASGRALISYDPNVRPLVLRSRAHARELVERNVRHAHLVKASRDDLEWLYPDQAVDVVASLWHSLGPSVVVVTEGAGGATAYRAAAEPLPRPGRAARVVDTIGAGDAFTAAMLNGLVRRGLHRPAGMGQLSARVLGEILDGRCWCRR